MKRILNLLSGVLLVVVVYFLDRSLDAARHTAFHEGEDGATRGHLAPRHQRTSHREARTMRKAFMWYVNMAMLIVFLAMLTCTTGCTPRRSTVQPEPAGIVLSPLVQNNLDFLYFAIAEKGGLEASFCMLGWTKDRTALVGRIAPVWVDSADFANLHHKPRSCSDSTTIGIVHLHPPGEGYCDLSDTDVISAHYLPWPTTAIVCKEHPDSLPKLVMVFRPEFDERWRNLPKGTDEGPPRTFVPAYRYRRPP